MPTVTRAARRTTTALFILGSCSCGGTADTERGEEWAGTVRDSAGVHLVSNPQTGIWNDKSRWVVERDLAIGALDGAPEYEFGHVVDVDAGPDGRIYVLDNQTAMVSVYDADGQFAFSFGGHGGGPGEFSIQAFAVLVDPVGVVVVRDGINRRDSFFNADGTFLRSVPLQGPFREWAALPDGDYVVRSSSPSWDGIVRIDSAGASKDTVLAFQYDIGKSLGALSAGRSRPPGARTEIPLLPPVPSWSVTSDSRIIAGTSERYRIEVRRPDGALEMLIERDHEALAVRLQDRAQMIDRVKDLMRAASLSEDAIAGVFDRFSYVPPDSLPAFAGLAGGPQGTIWVQGILPIDSMTANSLLDALIPGSPVSDVFSAEGRYLGQVAMPPRFTVKRIKGFHIYGVETDELDVQWVVRLKIRAAKEGS